MASTKWPGSTAQARFQFGILTPIGVIPVLLSTVRLHQVKELKWKQALALISMVINSWADCFDVFLTPVALIAFQNHPNLSRAFVFC